MTEHKFTDEEVIRAFENCYGITEGSCKGCPMYDSKRDKCKVNGESVCLESLVYDLINRQKAEISFWMDAAANAKKEAVKKFAERLKEKMQDLARLESGGEYLFLVGEAFIENVAKEMTEGKTK